MYFPEGFLLREKDDLKQKPSPPTKPVPPKSTIELMRNIGRTFDFTRPSFYVPGLTRISGEPQNVSGPKIRRNDGHEVEYHINRLKHGFSLKFDKLFLDFSESQKLISFQITYWINAANTPNNVEEILHVILESENT